MFRPSIAALSLGALLLARAASANLAAAAADDDSRLRWHESWRRVGAPEYAITVALGAGALALRQLDRADESRWSHPILHDSFMREHLRASSSAARRDASTASDALVWVSIVQPVVIDSVLVAWLGDSNPDVAWQTTVINAQAYAISNFVTHATKRLTDRARPYVDDCRPGAEGDQFCGSGSDHESFFSGHTSTSATSAGLVCAHHTNLPLYGSRLADTSACVASIGLTTSVGVLRIASDRHWATDVLTGHVTGFLVGYLLPTLAYYRVTRDRSGESESAARVGWVPEATPSGLTLSAFGWF